MRQRNRTLRLAAFGVAAAVAGTIAAAPPAVAAPAPSAAVPARVARSCAAPSRPGTMACLALRRTDVATRLGITATLTPAGFGPADLQSAYVLPSATQGNGATVAIVDAHDDPNAESDLAVYRAQYGLPPCTSANGCFRKVNQNGGTSPLPGSDTNWAAEISLDLDMVSAVCPLCRILLVEANSAFNSDLYTAVDYAAANAQFVSNSWGGGEYSGQTNDDQHFNHPGVAITFGTGDDGYAAGAMYPATSRYVTAVGGTSLFPAANARGWTESAWSGAGSGCSAFDSTPTWQNFFTGCTFRRAEADVAAVADPFTGVAVYDSFGQGGWNVFGGTSAAAPIIAGVYALAGTPRPGDYPASYPYITSGGRFDVTSGSNGNCGTAPSWWCNAGGGWDGPTGLGTPNGVSAFAPAPVNVIVPSEIGRTSTAATQNLQAVGLQVGHFFGEVQRNCDNIGKVVRQSPVAGTSVPSGSAVDLWLGQRPPRCP